MKAEKIRDLDAAELERQLQEMHEQMFRLSSRWPWGRPKG